MQVLSLYLDTRAALDRLLDRYLRRHRAIGAQDRREICAKAYHFVRNKRLIEALTTPPVSLERMLETAAHIPSEEDLDAMHLDAAIRYSVPDVLWQHLVSAYGESKATEIAQIWNSEAPTTIRANLAKISRDDLLKRFEAHGAFRCALAPAGIVFPKRLPLFSLPEFHEGLFEMQDEASQLVANLMQVKPGDHVMDFCSGSGGKTLGFAHLMQGKGQIYLHDIRPAALLEAKKRLKRAGVQHHQLLSPDTPLLKKLYQKMDWVLVDAPCSGTGTFRRNPDMKYGFTPENLMRVRGEQRMIFEKALSTLKPGGFIVYATCSILPEENEQQLAHLLATYPLTLAPSQVHTLPTKGGMDGFFAVVLQKQIPSKAHET